MIYHETVKDELLTALGQASKQAQRTRNAVLVSVTEEVAPFEPLEILERAKPLTNARAYWAQPDGELTLVGLGAAHAIDAVESMRFRRVADDWRQLTAGASVEGPRGLPGVGPLLLGGFAFDAERGTTDGWRQFPHARFTLPKLIFAKAQGKFWLTRAVVVDAETDVTFAALTLNEFVSEVGEGLTADGGRQTAENVSRGAIEARELVAQAEWERMVAAAIATIRRGEAEKLVLARAVQLHGAEPFDSERALGFFARQAPGTYQFAFAQGQDCFLGATPEQLVKVREGNLETMGLAGSMPRGATAEQDERFGQEMLASAKDRNEQEIVVRAMREVLGETCAQLEMSESPTLLKLKSIQHLVTRFSGKLNEGCSVLDLVERLHPTPAVGGRPREAALAWLRANERLDRGWYAGAVGWIDATLEGEFAVAIQSARLHENDATLFAGCGIVADSVPEDEYVESALKLKPMLAALGAGE